MEVESMSDDVGAGFDRVEALSPHEQGNVIAEDSYILQGCSIMSEGARGHPLDLLIEGLPQSITIPRKTVLNEIMRQFPSKKSPVYLLSKRGTDEFEVIVELDVCRSRGTVETEISVVRLVGAVGATPAIAEELAVEKAISYLREKHFVHVSDYSSEAVAGFERHVVWGHLNTVMHIVGKTLSQWSAVLDDVDNFKEQVKRIIFIETRYSARSSAIDVYAKSCNFISTMLPVSQQAYKANHSLFIDMESDHCKVITHINERATQFRLKACRQVMKFTMKDTLACVLGHLGLEDGEYINQPTDNGEFTGEVVINLPTIESVRCGGRTRFCGGIRLSADQSEQASAYKAVRYIESKMKVKVVDMNYTDRVVAESNHITMLKLLRKLVDLFGNIISDWSKMADFLASYEDLFVTSSLETDNNEQIGVKYAARKFCQQGIARISEECSREYNLAALNKVEVETYYPRWIDYDE